MFHVVSLRIMGERLSSAEDVARAINKLTAADVDRLVVAGQPGFFSDGAGLYLRIAAGGSASWALRYSLRGRAREAGIGPLHTVGLAEARKRAKALRLQVLNGVDVVQERHAARRLVADVVNVQDGR